MNIKAQRQSQQSKQTRKNIFWKVCLLYITPVHSYIMQEEAHDSTAEWSMPCVKTENVAHNFVQFL